MYPQSGTQVPSVPLRGCVGWEKAGPDTFFELSTGETVSYWTSPVE